MSNYAFCSVYAKHITDFISMKRSFGYKYITQEFILYHFDLYVISNNFTETSITPEVTEGWIRKRPHETDATRYGRISALIQLSSYMYDIGVSNYIPRMPQVAKYNFTPYIYSNDQMQAIFKACDHLALSGMHFNSVIIILPALIRMLYATGLRISEALNLPDKDVHLDENYLVVRDTKNRTERMIPISQSLSDICKQYVFYREKLPLKIDKEFFFLSLSGRQCKGKHTIHRWFKMVLKDAGIPFIGNHYGPRIHDLRHTFSVYAMEKMTREGADMYCSMSILSTYLGHKTAKSTEYYVRLCQQMYPELVKKVTFINQHIFPEPEYGND